MSKTKPLSTMDKEITILQIADEATREGKPTDINNRDLYPILEELEREKMIDCLYIPILYTENPRWRVNGIKLKGSDRLRTLLEIRRRESRWYKFFEIVKILLKTINPFIK